MTNLETEIDEMVDDYWLQLGRRQDFNSDPAIFKYLEERFHHTYILGKPGGGKSTLLERMAYYDFSEGYSVIFIDPKGETVDRLYSLCENKEKIIYVSFKHPIGLSPFSRKDYSIDTIITEFVQILDILITSTSPNPESTVRMKEVLYKTLKGFDEKDRNFNFLAKFLNSKKIRDDYKFSNPEYTTWWLDLEKSTSSGYHKASDFVRTMSSIESRISLFLENDEMKQFIVSDNELSIDELVNSNKSLFVNCYSSSRDNVLFLVNLIVYAVYSYIFKSFNRKPLLIYIDEFQLCASELFIDMLLFCRSFQVGFTLSHQNLYGIPKTLYDTIVDTVRNYVIFNCGYTEAKKFSDTFSLKPDDFLNLDKYYAWVRMGNKNTPIKTFPPLEVESINIPPPHSNILKSQYNFLKDGWITVS